MGRLATWLSRTFTSIASTTGNQAGSSGRFCHSTMLSMTEWVIVEIADIETDAP
jgi:hypothetical protein